uniref:UPF0587 protein C2D10.03c n=1 Tax=Lygus hesperus TaxID=30085 RepID=A0A0A9X9E0_LYGHE
MYVPLRLGNNILCFYAQIYGPQDATFTIEGGCDQCQEPLNGVVDVRAYVSIILFICVYLCLFVSICTYLYALVYVCIYSYVSVCTSVYWYPFACICVQVFLHLHIDSLGILTQRSVEVPNSREEANIVFHCKECKKCAYAKVLPLESTLKRLHRTAQYKFHKEIRTQNKLESDFAVLCKDTNSNAVFAIETRGFKIRRWEPVRIVCTTWTRASQFDSIPLASEDDDYFFEIDSPTGEVIQLYYVRSYLE